MIDRPLRFVVFGLSITSSWGNGHATNYRALVRALSRRGHSVLFLERDVPWYARSRDLPVPPWGDFELYDSLEDARARLADRVRAADAVIVGSFVPDGVELGHWVNDTARGVTLFYDIDTPVTLGKLEEGDHEYLEPELIPRYDVYLSFTGGPVLRALERAYGSPAARPFYCLVDLDEHRPVASTLAWDLGYLGTYSEDRQPGLERLLLDVARHSPRSRFCVAGPGFDSEDWPPNVVYRDHVAPPGHRAFYNRQRLTLNLTRARMIRAGWSPSVRLFEAAACGVPVVSDRWEGLDHFFQPASEIVLADDTEDVLRALRDIDPDEARRIGARARARVLAAHTAQHRVRELEEHVRLARLRRPSRDRPRAEDEALSSASPAAAAPEASRWTP